MFAILARKQSLAQCYEIGDKYSARLSRKGGNSERDLTG